MSPFTKFKYSKMDIELNKLRKEFIDFKENAKYKNLQKGRRESIFKTITKKTINKDILPDISQICNENNNENPTSSSPRKKKARIITLSYIGDILKHSDKDNLQNEENYKYIKQSLCYERKINDMKNNIAKLKSDELKRINIEFLYNDYERRFQVKKDKVVSVIVGEQNLGLELHKLNSLQKVYSKINNIMYNYFCS